MFVDLDRQRRSGLGLISSSSAGITTSPRNLLKALARADEKKPRRRTAGGAAMIGGSMVTRAGSLKDGWRLLGPRLGMRRRGGSLARRGGMAKARSSPLRSCMLPWNGWSSGEGYSISIAQSRSASCSALVNINCGYLLYSMIFADLCNYWCWGVAQIDVVRRVVSLLRKNISRAYLRQWVDG